jgi:hypothetical protein
MRRGLMAWDADEIPLAVLRERIERVQRAMAAAGQDALLLYTNFVRSAAVSHLTAFSPYWADGVLLVPQHGEPVFATSLSTRMASWIQSVKPIGVCVTSPAPGAVLGKRLAASGIKRLAILELDDFPGGLYADLAAALPGVEIVDGSATFAAARAHLDVVESRLLEKAASIAQAALENLTFDATTDVGHAIGAVERHARLQGAEEVYIAIVPDLDSDRRFLRLSGPGPLGRRFAIRATVAYKGNWVRHVKSFSHAGTDLPCMARAEAWFKAHLVSACENDSTFPHVAWLTEAAIGTRPLAIVASSDSPNEALGHGPGVVLTLALTVDGVPWCGAGLVRLPQENPA